MGAVISVECKPEKPNLKNPYNRENERKKYEKAVD